MALAALHQLVSRHLECFSSHLRQSILSGQIFENISQDVKLVDAANIITLSGVNLVVATPDSQPFNTAGKQLGFKDSRSSSFYHCLRIIREIHNLARQPLTYVVENVPRARRFKSIVDVLGLPLHVSARRLGSVARHETLLWTYSHSKEFSSHT